MVPVANQFSSGVNSSPIMVGDRRIGVTICYEDILPEFVRRRVLAVVSALVPLVIVALRSWSTRRVIKEDPMAKSGRLTQ
jgi:apolipoprotein N-acyltransferase